MPKANILINIHAEKPDGTSITLYEGCTYDVSVNANGAAWAYVPGVDGGVVSLRPEDYEILEHEDWDAPMNNVESSWKDFARRVLLIPDADYDKNDIKGAFYASALQVALLLQSAPESDLVANVERIRVEVSNLIGVYNDEKNRGR